MMEYSPRKLMLYDYLQNSHNAVLACKWRLISLFLYTKSFLPSAYICGVAYMFLV